MENTLFVILSDIHANERNIEKVNNRFSSLSNWLDCKMSTGKCNKALILVAGDIAFSGKTSEYNLVKPFFDDLSTKYNLITSPGNHDHNFSCYEGESSRDILLQSILDSNSKLDESIYNIVSKGQKEYFEFDKNVSNIETTQETLLSKGYKFSDEVYIQALNTAWCSSVSEQSGYLNFPLEQLITKKNNAKLNIAFFHHPFSWFDADNHKELRNNLRDSVDIIISGHEHQLDDFKVETDNSATLYIESCPLYDESVNENGFVTFSMENDDVIISKHIWEDNGYETKDNKRKSDIIDSSTKNIIGFIAKNDFLNELKDIGTNFVHPDAEELDTDNIFIYPNLKNMEDEKITVKRENSSELLNKHSDVNIVISGEEYIGKSTLLKKLCSDILNANDFAILVRGGDIKRADRFDISKLEKIITNQYEGFSFEKLSQKSGKKIILIDDFDYIQGNTKNLINLITEFEKYFSQIIISVSDSYELSENLVQGKATFSHNFVSYGILNFGHRSRWELIKKWNYLKRDCNDSEKELIRATDHAYKEINNIIGRNYIPSTPFFLLAMLQSMDSATPSDLNISSYGYYYQYLITTSLGVAKFKKEDLDEVFNYISELSFYYFQSGSIDIEKNKLWTFNDKINKEYRLKINCDDRLNRLENARILKRKNNYYSFRYPYIYYFFIAKYLSDNIEEESAQDVIKRLIDTLDKRRSMNILMFITHHSKNKNILHQIINRSKCLFEKYTACDLNKSSQFIDSLIENLDLEKIIFEETDVIENREQMEDAKDEYDDKLTQSKHTNSNIDEEEDNQDLSSMMNEFNLMVRSIELLGQLTKNYYGSLKAKPKEDLLLEAIEAPLRALESIFTLFRDDSDALLIAIENRLKKELTSHSTKNSDLKPLANKLLYKVLQMVSFQVIKKISSAIGSRNLLPVINTLVENDSTNAKKLIELSVQLDLGTLCSPHELKKLAKELNITSLSGSLLQFMILHYLYMFKESPNDVKSVCSAVGIDYRPIQKSLELEKTNLLNWQIPKN